MKLSAVVFARLIARITLITNWQFNKFDLEDIYDMIEFEVPEPRPNKVDPKKINDFLIALKNVNDGGYIPAIVCYRELTGCTLLTSKNAIEAFRNKELTPI